jgi:TM2 domain-containing membrane protein YozV
MKNFLLLFALALGVFMSTQTSAANFTVNEDAVDQLFENASATTLDLSTSNSMGDFDVEGKDPIIAIGLDFFFGYLGVHRFYMGTETMSGLLYPITCGGFVGIVPLIDLVVLIINYEDISPFVNNPTFFMPILVLK